jgi:hypothetical protein
MEKNLMECFRQATYEAEDYLPQNVWKNICVQNRHQSLQRFWGFFVLGVISGSIFVPAFKMLLSDFAKSGFYEYSSLAFSSNGTFNYYWKDFILSLTESLPLSSIVLSLGLFLVFFLSVRYAIKQITKGQLTLKT